MTDALSSALAAIAAARQVLRSRTPGTPAGDQDEEHEDNTYDLPEGRPIRRQFKRFAARQLRQTLSKLPQIGAPIPAVIPSLADWTSPMASAMTPLVGLYWDEAGQTTRARLGLDPNKWEVHDPHLHQVIQQQAFRFCQSTNETTDLELGAALQQLRNDLIAGLVTDGETIPELAARVQAVFSRLSNVRAEMIARTEAARAVHAASLLSAKESGVVSGKKWLLSGDACERCHAAAAKYPDGVGLDQPFADDGKGTDYSSCPAPPLHPNCRCSITFVLSEEYEQLLAEFGPPQPEKYDYDGGSLGPEPKRRKVAKPGKKPPVPKPELDLTDLENLLPEPTPKPDAAGNIAYPMPISGPGEPIPPKPAWQWGQVLEPGKPIGERIRLSAAWQRIQELAALPTTEDLLGEVNSIRTKITEIQADKTLDSATRQQKLSELNLRLEKIRNGGPQLLQQEARAKAAQMIQAPSGALPVEWQHDDRAKDPRLKDSISEARGWLDKSVAPESKTNTGSVKWREIGPNAEQRPYFHPVWKTVNLAANAPASIAIHEWAHQIEDRLPGAKAASLEFLKHRVGDEPLQKLSKVMGGKYKIWEKGRKDDFEKAFGNSAWYVGKDYGKEGTEVLSMGLEYLHRDPAGFSRKDPEFAAFIVGLLDGSLRSP